MNQKIEVICIKNIDWKPPSTLPSIEMLGRYKVIQQYMLNNKLLVRIEGYEHIWLDFEKHFIRAQN